MIKENLFYQLSLFVLSAVILITEKEITRAPLLESTSSNVKASRCMVANDICLKVNITKVNDISFELAIPQGNTKLYTKFHIV
jgi:hypothetical protein